MQSKNDFVTRRQYHFRLNCMRQQENCMRQQEKMVNPAFLLYNIEV